MVHFLLSKYTLNELFPNIEFSEVIIPVSQIFNKKDKMVLPLTELSTLGAICRQVNPKKIFEIGTYLGTSTLVMAMNTPPETEILLLI